MTLHSLGLQSLGLPMTNLPVLVERVREGLAVHRTYLLHSPEKSGNERGVRTQSADIPVTLPGEVDFAVSASLPISGLIAWQGLFEHGRLQSGQGVIARRGR